MSRCRCNEPDRDENWNLSGCEELRQLKTDLEFAYKRSKVLADMLNIPVHESPEVTGTILGLVRGSVERLLSENKAKQALIENYNLDMLMDIFKNKLEESIVETFKAGRGDAAAQCYQIASSHEFGPDAAKTIRETFGLEI